MRKITAETHTIVARSALELIHPYAADEKVKIGDPTKDQTTP